MASEAKPVMCLVCGKKFPRGVLDLARHITAVTLQHLASSKAKSDYDFHCAKCNLYFKVKEHLDMHMESVCPGNSKSKEKAPLSSPLPAPTPQSKSKSVQIKPETDGAADAGESAAEEEKTMECVVCGKLFPRGPIDLARHQTAITLRHLVHTKHTASFHFGCKKCGSHFTTAEHLAMHGAHSTCNEDMVWPTTVAPGSKCVTREEAAQLEAAEAAGVSEKAAKAAGSSKESQVKESKVVAAQEDEVPSKRSHKKGGAKAVEAPVLSKYMQNKLVMEKEKQRQQQLASASAGSGTKRPKADVAAFGGAALGTGELFTPRLKRAKVIVPEDRKAYFAVVSLLIDPASVPESVRLSEENYEAYLPPQHRKLVDALKANLFCTC